MRKLILGLGLRALVLIVLLTITVEGYWIFTLLANAPSDLAVLLGFLGSIALLTLVILAFTILVESTVILIKEFCA